MSATPLPDAEVTRLASLQCLRILDTPPEERFDRVTRVVAAHFGVSIVAINLIDHARQWTKSHVGMSSTEAPRTSSFCAQAIAQDEELVIPDTLNDSCFRDNPLVHAAPFLRFYAGIPLRSLQGYALGTLCIADTIARTLTATEHDHLRAFATWAERELTVAELSAALVQQHANDELVRMTAARYHTVIESLQEGVVLQDRDGTIQTWNSSAERILGLSGEQLQGRRSVDPRWHTIHTDGSPFPGDDHPAIVALRTGQPQADVVMGVHKSDGSLTWITITAQPLFHPTDTGAYGVVCSFTDSSERIRLEHSFQTRQRELEQHNTMLNVLATTDSLTEIMNKRGFIARLTHLMDDAAAKPLALILLDVDHFKAYNDTFGHVAGDAVLHQAAQVLCEHSRGYDCVARYGGEEFAVILPQTDAATAASVAERLRRALETAAWPHKSLTASFGVATLTQQLTREAFISRADQALYAAKRAGRNCVVIDDLSYTTARTDARNELGVLMPA